MLSSKEWYVLVIGIILGQILGIPFQLGTGLLSPSVQRWVEARRKAHAFAKSKRTRKQYEEALYFVTNPHKMTHYFLNRNAEVLRLGIFLFIALLGMTYNPFKDMSTAWRAAAWFSVAACYLFLLQVISQTVNRLHQIYYRVEFWNEYKKEVALQLPDVAEDPRG
jgi:hypothetical protein